MLILLIAIITISIIFLLALSFIVGNHLGHGYKRNTLPNGENLVRKLSFRSKYQMYLIMCVDEYYSGSTGEVVFAKVLWAYGRVGFKAL